KTSTVIKLFLAVVFLTVLIGIVTAIIPLLIIAAIVGVILWWEGKPSPFLPPVTLPAADFMTDITRRHLTTGELRRLTTTSGLTIPFHETLDIAPIVQNILIDLHEPRAEFVDGLADIHDAIDWNMRGKALPPTEHQGSK